MSNLRGSRLPKPFQAPLNMCPVCGLSGKQGLVPLLGCLGVTSPCFGAMHLLFAGPGRGARGELLVLGGSDMAHPTEREGGKGHMVTGCWSLVAAGCRRCIKCPKMQGLSCPWPPSSPPTHSSSPKKG